MKIYWLDVRNLFADQDEKKKRERPGPEFLHGSDGKAARFAGSAVTQDETCEKLFRRVLGLLSREERETAMAFRFSRDRLLYASAHAMTRTVLAAKADDPLSLTFVRNAYGKPFLARTPALRFNLSHSWPWAALVVSTRRSCGVDVESVDAGDNWREIVGYACNRDDMRRISLSENPSLAFIRVWTAKEAVSKALGRGLSLPFQDIEFDSAMGRVRVRGKMVRMALRIDETLVPGAVMATAWAGRDHPEPGPETAFFQL